MTLATKRRKFWSCPKCKHRNEATRSRKCQGCGELSRPVRNPGKRKPRESYAVFNQANAAIHGIMDESCGVCGKPRVNHRLDRDHDHNTGLPRGLACGGDNGCNKLMARWITPAVAAAIFDAKYAANEPDAERWRLIAAYLERVENYYREQDVDTGQE